MYVCAYIHIDIESGALWGPPYHRFYEFFSMCIHFVFIDLLFLYVYIYIYIQRFSTCIRCGHTVVRHKHANPICQG